MSTPVSTSEDDGAIIARVLEGDVAAFEVLIRRHNRSVFSRGARSWGAMTKRKT